MLGFPTLTFPGFRIATLVGVVCNLILPNDDEGASSELPFEQSEVTETLPMHGGAGAENVYSKEDKLDSIDE